MFSITQKTHEYMNLVLMEKSRIHGIDRTPEMRGG